MSEKDFECFASTGVNTPETIIDHSPRSGNMHRLESLRPQALSSLGREIEAIIKGVPLLSSVSVLFRPGESGSASELNPSHL